MDNMKICLIEKNPLIREGLKSVLHKSKFKVAIEISHIGDLEKNDAQDYELAIYSSEEYTADIDRTIFSLKQHNPNARNMVLSERIDRDIIAACFAAGVDGFLLKDISAKSLIASLDLVMVGEKVFPTSMGLLMAAGWDCRQNTADADFFKDADFSQRAVEIIRCLALGDSNKLIARKLNITESTVKVHMKAILGKLSLANRTQVAIWAVRHGIPSAPESHPQKNELN